MKKPKASPFERLGRLKSLRYLAAYIDHDYLSKLNLTEATWLADFDEEFYQGKGQKVWSKRSDALCIADVSPDDERATSASAEDILISLEDLNSSRGK